MPAAVTEDPTRSTSNEFDPEHYLRERYVSTGEAAPARALRAYYAVKPLMPRRLQLALRRRHARRRARREFPGWPVEPILVEHHNEQVRRAVRAAGGEVPLVGEWPDGHAFAAVLTHDVEGPAGVANVLRVIDVERRHGLVSSWNFVAEWYPIPDGLFDEVRALGCEIGLHGIRHDGRLFRDRATFEANLPAIHRYLREWEAVGFRSPATHRNAEWMHELGCLYDSSFPDTDPFEPQPGGCCSILPFLLDGLVELPITLVQDHTLWEILRDDSIAVWRDKADWIIRNRGLVNLIVHPDYVVTDARLALYEEFCRFLREQLDHRRGWHALPREVAAWWKTREGLHIDTSDGAPRIVSATGHPEAARATVVHARETADGVLAVE